MCAAIDVFVVKYLFGIITCKGYRGSGLLTSRKVRQAWERPNGTWLRIRPLLYQMRRTLRKPLQGERFFCLYWLSYGIYDDGTLLRFTSTFIDMQKKWQENMKCLICIYFSSWSENYIWLSFYWCIFPRYRQGCYANPLNKSEQAFAVYMCVVETESFA